MNASKKEGKLRIGILTHNYPKDSKESRDAGKFIYTYSHELSKQANVFVFCPDYGGKKEKDTKVPVTWFDWGGNGKKFGSWNFFSPTSVFRFVKLITSGNKELIRFIKEREIDYLLCFWTFPSGIFAYFAKKKLGIGYSTWSLGSDIYIYPKLPVVIQLTQIVLKDADHRFGNSYDICKAIKKISGMTAEFLTTSNPIMIKKYISPKLNEHNYNFLCIARLEKVKGPDILLEAAKLLKQKSNDFSITFIGSGSMFSSLNDRVKEYGLSDNVKILGYVEDQALVNGYLKNSDCLIIPSRSESFPLVITEAIQTGLSMIGSDVGDMPLFIKGNKIGFIFKKENSEDLASCMGKMMKHGRVLGKKNKSLMKKLSDQFKMESIVENFLSSITIDSFSKN